MHANPKSVLIQLPINMSFITKSQDSTTQYEIVIQLLWAIKINKVPSLSCQKMKKVILKLR